MSKPVSKRSKQPSTNIKALQPPTPFEKAPPSLTPFTELLDPAQVYIAHIDTHKIDYKKQIFLIPVLLNASIAVLLLYRLYTAGPEYLAIVQTFFGYASTATVDTETTTRSEQAWILARRVAMFAADFLFFRFIGPWPLTFFFEQPANPCTWRWNLGFQPKEIIVRGSRNWGAEELMKGIKQGEENPFFKTRILPAIDKEFMKKTGYLMMDRSWDLDFQLMLDAHTLVSKQHRAKIEDLDKVVLAYLEGVGWLRWIWDVPEITTEDDRRQKVVDFKERLTAMGKESLFWRWTEIVEEERSADGGFTTEGQQKVASRVQKEFAASGVSFEAVVQSIGGMDQIPDINKAP